MIRNPNSKNLVHEAGIDAKLFVDPVANIVLTRPVGLYSRCILYGLGLGRISHLHRNNQAVALKKFGYQFGTRIHMNKTIASCLFAHISPEAQTSITRGWSEPIAVVGITEKPRLVGNLLLGHGLVPNHPIRNFGCGHGPSIIGQRAVAKGIVVTAHAGLVAIADVVGVGSRRSRTQKKHDQP